MLRIVARVIVILQSKPNWSKQLDDEHYEANLSSYFRLAHCDGIRLLE